MSNKIEFLIAWDDGTWTTEVVEVGADAYHAYLSTQDSRVFDSVTENLLNQVRFRKAVAIFLYCVLSQDE